MVFCVLDSNHKGWNNQSLVCNLGMFQSEPLIRPGSEIDDGICSWWIYSPKQNDHQLPSAIPSNEPNQFFGTQIVHSFQADLHMCHGRGPLDFDPFGPGQLHATGPTDLYKTGPFDFDWSGEIWSGTNCRQNQWSLRELGRFQQNHHYQLLPGTFLVSWLGMTLIYILFFTIPCGKNLQKAAASEVRHPVLVLWSSKESTAAPECQGGLSTKLDHLLGFDLHLHLLYHRCSEVLNFGWHGVTLRFFGSYHFKFHIFMILSVYSWPGWLF